MAHEHTPETVRAIHVDEHGHEYTFYVSMVPQHVGACGIGITGSYRARISLEVGSVGGDDPEVAIHKLQGLAGLFADAHFLGGDVEELEIKRR